MAEQGTAMNVRMLIATLPETENLPAWCRRLGISRQSAYKWRRRYRDEGPFGLADRSRAAKQPAGRLESAMEDRIVELRKALLDEGFDAGPASIQWYLMEAG